MGRFSIVEDSYCILRVAGVFRQVDIYARGKEFYAKVGAGYVLLLKHGYTSHPNAKWLEQQRGAGAEIVTP